MRDIAIGSSPAVVFSVRREELCDDTKSDCRGTGLDEDRLDYFFQDMHTNS